MSMYCLPFSAPAPVFQYGMVGCHGPVRHALSPFDSKPCTLHPYPQPILWNMASALDPYQHLHHYHASPVLSASPPSWGLPNTTPFWPSYHRVLPSMTPFTSDNCHLPPLWGDEAFGSRFPGTEIPCPIRLSQHLCCNSENLSKPVLQWDIIQAPELARVINGRQTIVSFDLDALAVEPAASKIYIVSDHPVLAFWMKKWGPIMVEKPDTVKVWDVLNSIHKYFQTPLTSKELQKVGSVRGNKDILKQAADARIKDSYDALPPITARSGFKRSDVMGGHRRYQGLRAVVFEDNTWKLILHLLSGPVPDVL